MHLLYLCPVGLPRRIALSHCAICCLNSSTMVQVDDLEEAIFFIFAFMQAYARSHAHVKALK